MSEDRIHKILEHAIPREIVSLCQQPLTSKDVIAKVVKKFGVKVGVVGGYLKLLENAKAIKYSEGKWETEDKTVQVLKKYYVPS